MTSQERFHALVNFQPFDRLPLVEWATWWTKTIERWHTEALPESVKGRYELYEHFGLEYYAQDWIGHHRATFPHPKEHGHGVVACEADYDALLPHIYGNPVNLEGWSQWQKRKEQGDYVLWFTVNGFFWWPRTLFGIEEHLYAFYDHPELMHRMCEDLVQDILRILDQVCSVAQPDFMTFAEDMSYNNGPMLSEAMFDEFLRPHYEKLIPEIKKRGIIPVVDTDGNVHDAAGWYRSAGMDGILPLERQAGVDLSKLREENPQMLFLGAFDKMTMNKGEEAMRAEFERLLPVAAKGGYILSVDHQTPPGVSYQQYLDYLRLFREYAEKAGALSRALQPVAH